MDSHTDKINYQNIDVTSEIYKKVAEYDPIMGLWYIEGYKYKDGSGMIPLNKYDFEDEKKWQPL